MTYLLYHEESQLSRVLQSRGYGVFYEKGNVVPFFHAYADTSKYNGYIRISMKTQTDFKTIKTVKRSEYEQLEKLQTYNSCDYYISANTYKTTKRATKGDILGYNNVVIDIDSHSDYISLYERTEAINAFVFRYAEHGLPEPTIIHKTGRGLQLWYHVQQASSKLGFLYDETRQCLINACSQLIDEYPSELSILNADERACSGMYRMFNSINTKTGTTTEYVCKDTNYTLPELHELVEQYKQEPEKKKQITLYQVRSPAEYLHKGRLNVIKAVAEKQTEPGKRNAIIYLGYNEALGLYDEPTAKAYVNMLVCDLNKRMQDQITQAEVEAVFKSARGKVHNIRTETFCNKLGISEEEYRKYSNKREAERQEKRDAKAEKRALIVEMLKDKRNKKTLKEIAEKTNTSLRAVNYIKASLRQGKK